MSTRWPWSHEEHGESSSHGEALSWGFTTGISRSEPISSWPSSGDGSASSAHVKNAAQGLEREIRLLATRLTVAEFHAVRVRLEDVFDDVLLNHLP
jgi:hypothetical protein